MIAAARVRITGVVQGVGFRPFVYNLARGLGLTGAVSNDSEGVSVLVEGAPEAIARFTREARTLAPPQARVETVEVVEAEPEGCADFTIRESGRSDGAMTLVSPDIATCPACLAEMSEPSDRRHRYPFVNCTNCGPRFTIIEDVPYDRPSTTMRDFPMCPRCAAEYRDPSDRRFHAQPNACPVCGPRLYLNPAVADRADAGRGRRDGADLEWDPSKETAPRPHRDRSEEAARTDAVLEAAVSMLASGDILAIKGLGGFHLACDATDEQAVSRLRQRKRRWGKPFAVMFADLESVRTACEVGEEEAALLEGSVRPIVLLLRRDSGGALAPSVAPGLAELGVMLPYTPLHHLLLRGSGGPLVMTSGNTSDEPIAMTNEEALDRLAPLADGFLLHDRGIHARYDDSVVRVVEGRTESVRRARGYAPYPLHLPRPWTAHVLAAGPEQKSTFCLTRDGYAFVSGHIGDLENAETLEAYENAIALYERMFRIEPGLVAHDLHPEYLATKHAKRLGLPLEGVQHHHAHIAAVTAEHGVASTVVGLAFDGTGYGPDGTVWGGEVLLSTWTAFERFAHLRPVPMPGGAAAIRRPARMALGLLMGMDRGLLDHPGAACLHETLATDELANVLTMAARGINSPLTSSMGRLFDAVAALTGVRSDAVYEGQAAIELEAVADRAEPRAYTFGMGDGAPAVIDPLPVIEAILDDLRRGVGAPAISARFHNAVVSMSVAVALAAAEAAGTRAVALGGGVFMNRLVLAGVLRGLEDAGLTTLVPRDLPVNDGAISFGQAVVALARRDAV